MKRLIVAISTAALLIMAPPAAVLADPGAPGTTFPEQPGTNVGTACTSVTTNPGTGNGGAAMEHGSPTAAQITSGLVADACLP